MLRLLIGFIWSHLMLSRTIAILLLFCSLALAVIIAMPYSYDNETKIIGKHSESVLLSESIINKLGQRTQLMDMDFSDFSEKPLFNSSRKKNQPKPQAKPIDIALAEPKPVETKPEPKKIQKPKPKLPILLGIMMVNNTQAAFVKADDGISQIVKTGEQYKDWNVEDITANSLVLSFDGSDETVTLLWAKSEVLESRDITAENNLNLPSKNATTVPAFYKELLNLK